MRYRFGVKLVEVCLLALLAASATPRWAWAQKAPDVGYVYPPGGCAGTTVDVVLGGFDWTPDMQFFVHRPGVQLTILGPPGEILVPEPPYWFGPKAYDPAPLLPRETPARFAIPADCRAGPVYWQAANANGVTATGIFMVSRGPELIESPRHREPQPIENLPATVSGRLARIEEIDRYRFTAAHSGPVTCSLAARRIGSAFFGVLEVQDADGRLVADAFDTEGLDIDLAFAGQEGRDYVVSVRDVDFRGDRSYVYRLEITPGPRVIAARPAAGRRGESQSVEFIGVGLASGADKLESVTRQITFPNDPATATLNYRLETPFGVSPEFPLLLSDVAESVEGDRPAGAPQPLGVPAAVTGSLDRRGEQDLYICQGKKGDLWAVTTDARQIGSAIDPVIAIRDGSGKELARTADQPGAIDCALEFNVPEDGLYTLSVSDMAGRGGSRAAGYRLSVEPARPDFSLQARVQRLSIPLGQKAELTVSAVRRGGFKEPIELLIDGLPPGVSAEGELLIPADKSELKINLLSAADAAATATAVEIRGTARCGDVRVTRIALAPAAGNLAPRCAGECTIDRLVVATTLKPVCKVEPVSKDGGRLVHRGATYPAEMIVERLGGFDGPVTLEMAAQQQRHRQGITGKAVVASPGVSRIAFGCYMPEWLETARTSRMAVLGVAQVADPRGNVRYSVAEVSGQITMTVEGALLKITPVARELTVPTGQPLLIEIRLQRSATLAEPARLELHLDDELQGLFTAEPLIVPPDQTTATIRIVPAAGNRLLGRDELAIRATVLQDGQWPVISETSVPVEFIAPRRD